MPIDEPGTAPAGAADEAAHGELDRLAARDPDAPTPWLDFATGANPWPYPVAIPSNAWTRPPQGRDREAARAAVASYLAVDDPDNIALLPGVEAAIAHLPHCLEPTRVAVLMPIYDSHAPAWRAAGHDVREMTGDEVAASDAPVVVLANPNDRHGGVIQPEVLRDLAETCRARGGLLVVDEAFCDLMPEVSISSDAPHGSTVVLRSLGKGFGLVGVRAGAMVAPTALTHAMRERLGPWAISGPALAAMASAYGDPSWMADMRARLDAAARELDTHLRAAGLANVGGTALFRLVETPMAVHVQATLARHGIAVRRFPGDPYHLRIGIPPDAAARERLIAGLEDALAS